MQARSIVLWVSSAASLVSRSFSAAEHRCSECVYQHECSLLLLLGSCRSAALVFEVRHQFQMLRIAAQSVVAQMIDLAIAGDVAEVVCVGDEMNSHSVAVQTHSSVAATTSITGG